MEQKDRKKIVADNFDYYLKKSGKKAKQYAKDTGVGNTTISKWKGGDTGLTIDQVYQAAEYFDITVNDLFYDEMEKRKLSVLSDPGYTKIEAKKIYNFKNIMETIKKPKILVYLLLIFTVLLGIVIYFTRTNVIALMITSLILFAAFFLVLRRQVIQETDFILDYLDEIYYLKAGKEKKGKINKLLKIALCIVILITSIFFIMEYSKLDSDKYTEVVLLLVAILLWVVGLGLTVINTPNIYEDKMTDTGLNTYFANIIFLLIGITFSGVIIYLSFRIINFCFLIPSLLILGLHIGDFIILFNKVKDYDIYIAIDGENARKLYK